MINKDRAVVMAALRELHGYAGYLAVTAAGAGEVVQGDPDDALAPAFAQLSADFAACAEQASGMIERLERTPKEMTDETPT